LATVDEDAAPLTGGRCPLLPVYRLRTPGFSPSGRGRRYPQQVPRTIVIDSRTVPVRLRAQGFNASKITPPTLAVEGSVRAALTRPGRVEARWFVSTLLAGCLWPRRRASELDALAEPDRARLRRALVDVCDEGACWRALYGSHLNADERLLAVMVWRHRRHYGQADQMIAKLVAARAAFLRTTAEGMGVDDRIPRDLATKLSGMLTLTTQAQRAATMYTGLIQPYPTLNIGLGLGHPAQLNSAHSVAARAIGQFGVGDGLGLGQSSLLEAFKGAGIAGSGQASWMKAFMGAEEAPWLKALKGAGMGGDALAISRAMQVQIPSASKILESFGRKIQLSDETLRFYRETDQFMQDWEKDALWLLFLHVGVSAVRPLARLSRSEVEAVVLCALEMVFSDRRFVPALRAAVATAPHLTSTQRTHLDHMLEHAQEGEYVEQVRPCIPDWRAPTARPRMHQPSPYVPMAPRGRLDS
jgi:hypothetical protein